MKCKRCGSTAYNPSLHGRDGSDLDLCDVCYWRKRAEDRARVLEDIIEVANEIDLDT